MMVHAINRRTHNEYAAEAGLHGVKIPFQHNRELEASEPEPPMDAAAAAQAMQEAQDRVRKRYGG